MGCFCKAIFFILFAKTPQLIVERGSYLASQDSPLAKELHGWANTVFYLLPLKSSMGMQVNDSQVFAHSEDEKLFYSPAERSVDAAAAANRSVNR